MQFLTSLLGGPDSVALISVLALGVVALIVVSLWVPRYFMKPGQPMRTASRRLQVVDQLPVDGKRQLLIVRRDNVEHLILTGGPQDLLIESSVPVADSAGRAPRKQQPPVEDVLRQVAATAAPTETVRPAAMRPHIERLREFARPGATRKPQSLRHTGLLRPVSVMEPAVVPMQPLAGEGTSRLRADGRPQSEGQNAGATAAAAFRKDGATDIQ